MHILRARGKPRIPILALLAALAALAVPIPALAAPPPDAGGTALLKQVLTAQVEVVGQEEVQAILQVSTSPPAQIAALTSIDRPTRTAPLAVLGGDSSGSSLSATQFVGLHGAMLAKVAFTPSPGYWQLE